MECTTGHDCFRWDWQAHGDECPLCQALAKKGAWRVRVIHEHDRLKKEAAKWEAEAIDLQNRLPVLEKENERLKKELAEEREEVRRIGDDSDRLTGKNNDLVSEIKRLEGELAEADEARSVVRRQRDGGRERLFRAQLEIRRLRKKLDEVDNWTPLPQDEPMTITVPDPDAPVRELEARVKALEAGHEPICRLEERVMALERSHKVNAGAHCSINDWMVNLEKRLTAQEEKETK